MANVTASEISQTRFVTNDNLQPCNKCGKRIVGGCDCAMKNFNCNTYSYNFQCVYCAHMKIDYSPAIGGLDNNCDRTIRLSQGQEVNLSVAGNKLLTQLMIGVGWDPKIIGNNMDIDSTVFVSNDTKCEKVYFGNLIHSSGCVVHHGDNLTEKCLRDSGRR